MRIDRLEQAGTWVVLDDRGDDVPYILFVCNTRAEARQYIKGERPSLL